MLGGRIAVHSVQQAHLTKTLSHHHDYTQILKRLAPKVSPDLPPPLLLSSNNNNVTQTTTTQQLKRKKSSDEEDRARGSDSSIKWVIHFITLVVFTYYLLTAAAFPSHSILASTPFHSLASLSLHCARTDHPPDDLRWAI